MFELGLEYGVGRVNMGGCDFSDRPYTLCDTPGDVDLQTFNLTHDDYDFKIPYIKMAQDFSEKVKDRPEGGERLRCFL